MHASIPRGGPTLPRGVGFGGALVFGADAERGMEMGPLPAATTTQPVFGYGRWVTFDRFGSRKGDSEREVFASTATLGRSILVAADTDIVAVLGNCWEITGKFHEHAVPFFRFVCIVSPPQPNHIFTYGCHLPPPGPPPLTTHGRIECLGA